MTPFFLQFSQEMPTNITIFLFQNQSSCRRNRPRFVIASLIGLVLLIIKSQTHSQRVHSLPDVGKIKLMSNRRRYLLVNFEASECSVWNASFFCNSSARKCRLMGQFVIEISLLGDQGVFCYFDELQGCPPLYGVYNRVAKKLFWAKFMSCSWLFFGDFSRSFFENSAVASKEKLSTNKKTNFQSPRLTLVLFHRRTPQPFGYLKST